MNLQVKCAITKGARDVTSQTKRLIYGAVSALHVQDYARVIGDAKVVGDFSRH